jgi:hypothetical protein
MRLIVVVRFVEWARKVSTAVRLGREAVHLYRVCATARAAGAKIRGRTDVARADFRAKHWTRVRDSESEPPLEV